MNTKDGGADDKRQTFNSKTLAGRMLHSNSISSDDYFANAHVIITEHNDDGAIGFIINRNHARKFNELLEFKDSKALNLFEGGPVENESLYFIHQRPDIIKEGLQISGTLYTGGDFKKAVQSLNENLINDSDVMLFVGYCGWDQGELETEIKKGDWIISPTNYTDLHRLIKKANK